MAIERDDKVMKNWHNCTKEEKIERWTNVVRVLEGLSEHDRTKHWDMSIFGTKNECGTVACAAGHCGLDSWFRKRGFRMDVKMVEVNLDNTMLLGSGFRYFGPDIKIPVTKISDVTSFFGYDGANDIFYNERKRSVATVLREVKKHIKVLEASDGE